MKKTATHKARKWLLLLAIAATIPMQTTCSGQNAQSLFILDVLALSQRQQCAVQPGQSAQQIRFAGIMDLMLTNTYWLFPRFRNMMQPINSITGETTESPEAETNWLSVQTAKVFVDMGEFSPTSKDSDHTKQIATKYILEGVYYYVAEGLAPNTEGVVGMPAIGADLGNVFDEKIYELVHGTSAVESPGIWITAFVTLEAQTLDRWVVHSNEFAFPIQLCYGCLIRYTNPESITNTPCIPGQDDAIDCPLCPLIANHPEDCPTCPARL